MALKHSIFMRNFIPKFFLILTLILLFGQAKASDDAFYISPEYIREDSSKIDCELNGAWTTNYSYFWLPDPTNTKSNLPDFIQNIDYQGVLKEADTISVSTPEFPDQHGDRNKYFLSSALPGEKLSVKVNVINNSKFISWYPLAIYIDPFVSKGNQQKVSVSLSYASTSLGHVVYLQNTNFQEGCYLNLLIKSPLPGASGQVTLELNPQPDSPATISALFWGEAKEETNINIVPTGTVSVSAPLYFQDYKNSIQADIWSPGVDESDKLVKVSLGDIKYVTSTGYEFPISVKLRDTYNFKALKGMAGPAGLNGLEFYLTPQKDFCSNGCDLGLYFVEEYKQKIYIYTAQKDKKNKLSVLKRTTGNASFETFSIQPNNDVVLRIRVTTEDNSSLVPVLNGLYLRQSSGGSVLPVVDQNDKDPVLSLDAEDNTNKPKKEDMISMMSPQEGIPNTADITNGPNNVQGTEAVPESQDDIQISGALSDGSTMSTEASSGSLFIQEIVSTVNVSSNNNLLPIIQTNTSVVISDGVQNSIIPSNILPTENAINIEVSSVGSLIETIITTVNSPAENNLLPVIQSENYGPSRPDIHPSMGIPEDVKQVIEAIKEGIKDIKDHDNEEAKENKKELSEDIKQAIEAIKEAKNDFKELPFEWDRK